MTQKREIKITPHLLASLPHNVAGRQAAVALAIYNFQLRIPFLYPEFGCKEKTKQWFLEKNKEI